MGDPFHVELQRLREAAGKTYHGLIAMGDAQLPPLRLSKQTLSDWFTGKVRAPRDPDRVKDQDRLIALMESAAKRRSGYTPHGIEWWRKFRAESAEDSTDRLMLGRVVSELTDADAVELYEVHRSITTEEPGASVLTPYLKRAHDDRLRAELAEAAHGSANRVIMLVGGSSTGKTRACWEAIRDVLSSWSLWHPLVPDRPEAILNKLSSRRVAPRTVIWLNEAQMYLKPAGIGEHVATALQALLHDQAGPIVVLGSMWPDYWKELTAPDSEEHAAARNLLADRDIPVPLEFSEHDLAEAVEQIAADPRLRAAARSGRGITQYLAGAPELRRRYEQANPYAKAIIYAAMDARRLSRWLKLPPDFLRRAAPGYLTDHDWGRTDDNNKWFRHALEELTEECHGADGVLAPRKARPGGTARKITYRLADYLEHLGLKERVRHYPPVTFWTAAAQTCTEPGVLSDLATAAFSRGRRRRSAVFSVLAGRHGDTSALTHLAKTQQKNGDPAGAEQLLREAADLGDAAAFRLLADPRKKNGDQAGAEQLLREAADRGDIPAFWLLAALRRGEGDRSGAEQLLHEAADRGDTTTLELLAMRRERAGDPAGAEQLARQAADRGSTIAFRLLADVREENGDLAGAEQLWREAADRGDTTTLRLLAMRRERAGDPAGAEQLARQAADRGSTIAFHYLADLREKDGDPAGAEQLLHEAADCGSKFTLGHLIKLRQKRGDLVGAEQLLREAADRGDTSALCLLAMRRENAGDSAGAEQLLREAADRGGRAIAIQYLAFLREKRGDPGGAQLLRAWGLDDDGSPAAAWTIDAVLADIAQN